MQNVAILLPTSVDEAYSRQEHQARGGAERRRHAARRGGEAVETKTGPSRGKRVCHVTRMRSSSPSLTRTSRNAPTPARAHAARQQPPWTNPTIARDGNSRARGFPCNTRSRSAWRGRFGTKTPKVGIRVGAAKGRRGPAGGWSGVPYTSPRRSRAVCVSRRGSLASGLEGSARCRCPWPPARCACRSPSRFCANILRHGQRETAPAV
jgi:hypothetical protein